MRGRPSRLVSSVVLVLALATFSFVDAKILLTLDDDKEYEVDGLHEAAAEGNLAKLDELLDADDCDGMPRHCTQSCFSCFFFDEGGDGAACAPAKVAGARPTCKAQCRDYLVCAGDEYVNHFDSTGTAPIHWAAARCNLFAVRALLQKGANVELTSGQRPGRRYADVKAHFGTMTPLVAASTYGCSMVVDALVKAGADVNGRDSSNDNTALVTSAAKGHINVVEKLLRLGADPNLSSDGGTTPLMAAAKGPGASDKGLEDVPSNPEIVRALVKAGAALDEQDEYNEMSALMYAAHAGSLKAVRILVDAGADVMLTSAVAKDEKSFTAADWARFAGHERIAKELEALEAAKAARQAIMGSATSRTKKAEL